MPEHTFLESGKGDICPTILGRQVRTLFVEVFIAPSPPGTVGYGQHVRVKAVFPDYVFFRFHQAVVPDGQDDTGHIVVAFGMVVIEMVQVMETGVDGRYPRLGFAAVTPQVCHIDLSRLIMPSRVPGDHFFAF